MTLKINARCVSTFGTSSTAAAGADSPAPELLAPPASSLYLPWIMQQMDGAQELLFPAPQDAAPPLPVGEMPPQTDEFSPSPAETEP